MAVGSRAHPLQLESSARLVLKDFSQDCVTRRRTPTTNGGIVCEIASLQKMVYLT